MYRFENKKLQDIVAGKVFKDTLQHRTHDTRARQNYFEDVGVIYPEIGLLGGRVPALYDELCNLP